MSDEKLGKDTTLEDAELRNRRPLLQDGKHVVYVPVSHKELDDLVGRLMQMYELNGDVEQRNALKQETKWRCREWLDNLYSLSGYEFNEPKDGTQIVHI